MIWQHMTWQQVERYLESRSDIIVPVGSTEQHGPTGLIGTDAICAETVTRRTADRAGSLAAPTIPYGQAQFNLDFPGTISATARTLMGLIRDIVVSLADQGFTHFYFLNGHGGNIAPAEAAFQDLYHARRGQAAIRCRLRSWWDFENVSAIRDRLYGEWEGLHATPSEISITRAVVEAAVVKAAIGDSEPPSSLETADPALLRDHARDRHYDTASHRAAFPDGRVGSNPWLASREAGEELIEAAVVAAAADLEAFLKE